MTISLAPKHLARYKELAGLFLKYGHGELANDLRAKSELPELPEETAAHPSPKAEELAADLERLGPTFVKLGQLFSTRADLLPAPYLEALSRLQDEVEPFPFAEASRIVS
ncbi:MAG TPA: AarF/ABC1/UbiB kinase family protein, partial [Thermoanaerobaculia bacterium]|nr:AarF/ABC1/UbiB kinase family protein [Thermoanaerobaculia bacterium]